MSAAAPLVTDDKGRRDLVKELAEAVSTQAQVANGTWLALMTVALLTVVPHNSASQGNISLPFNLGEVPPVWFHGLTFSLIVVLAVSFAAAHCQQIRAQKLAHSVVDSIPSSIGMGEVVHPREYFDMLRKPTLNRVGSLAQSLRGKYQFVASNANLPRWLQLLTVVYYGLLKSVSIIIYFMLPIWALWQAHQNFLASGPLHGFIVVGVVGALVAGFALIQVLCLDLLYAAKVLKHLWGMPH